MLEICELIFLSIPEEKREAGEADNRAVWHNEKMEEVGGPTTGYCSGQKTRIPRSDKPNFIQKSMLVITTKLLNEAHGSPLPTSPQPSPSHPLFWPLYNSTLENNLSWVRKWSQTLGWAQPTVVSGKTASRSPKREANDIDSSIQKFWAS